MLFLNMYGCYQQCRTAVLVTFLSCKKSCMQPTMQPCFASHKTVLPALHGKVCITYDTLLLCKLHFCPLRRSYVCKYLLQYSSAMLVIIFFFKRVMQITSNTTMQSWLKFSLLRRVHAYYHRRSFACILSNFIIDSNDFSMTTLVVMAHFYYL